MSVLGKNIKALRKQFNYSQNDLANLLDVSQTSVAHYEAGTRQPTIETLMRLSQLFDETIDRLVGHSIMTEKNIPRKKTKKYNDIVDELLQSLLQKDEQKFMELFEENVFPNFELIHIFESILKTVMYKIGDLWEQGIITEADEHYASYIIQKALHYVDFNIEKTIRNKKAISLIIGPEKHSLGIEMIGTILESEGVESLFLGGNLPYKSIEKAIIDYDPNYIFISITMKDYQNNLNQLVEMINEKFNRRIKIIIGGQGVGLYQDVSSFDNVYILHNINEVKEFVEKD